MMWNSLDSRPKEQRWIWLSIVGWLLVLRGPGFIVNLHPRHSFIPDFFQEYASARSWLEGGPVYASHHVTAPRYLGVTLDPHSPFVVNAHPPTAVLLALPLTRLDFGRAFLVWNLASLAALAASLVVVQRALRVPFSTWSLAPLLALLLLCFPLWEQCRLGQLTLLLLLMITSAWAAERSGRPQMTGMLLGAATCIKLVPGFLFAYYALRGQWRVVVAGLITIVSLSAVTGAILGVEAYRAYFLTVLPEVQWFRVGWNNNSLWGFWSRLFDPAPEHERYWSLTKPLYYSPMLATTLSLMSAAVITGLLAWAVRGGARGSATHGTADSLIPPPADADPEGEAIRTASAEGLPRQDSRSGFPAQRLKPVVLESPTYSRIFHTRELVPAGSLKARENDLTFAMAVTAMLLVSPICWEHYLLLLLAPLAIVWMELQPSRFARTAFVMVLAAFLVECPVTWTAFGLNGRTATPIDSISVLSYRFYALLVFFAVTMMSLRSR